MRSASSTFCVSSSRFRHSRGSRAIFSHARPLQAMSQCEHQNSCVLFLLHSAPPTFRSSCVLLIMRTASSAFYALSSRFRHSRKSRATFSRARPLQAMSEYEPQISCVPLLLRPAPPAFCSSCVLRLLRPVFYHRGSAIRGSRVLYRHALALSRRCPSVNTKFPASCSSCVLLIMRPASSALIITVPAFAGVACYILTRSPSPGDVPV